MTYLKNLWKSKKEAMPLQISPTPLRQDHPSWQFFRESKLSVTLMKLIYAIVGLAPWPISTGKSRKRIHRSKKEGKVSVLNPPCNCKDFSIKMYSNFDDKMQKNAKKNAQQMSTYGKKTRLLLTCLFSNE